MNRFRSIRWKLLAIYMMALALGFTAFGVIIYTAFRHYMTEYLAHNLERRAHQISGSLMENLDKTGFPYVGMEIEARYAPTLSDGYILVRDSQANDIYTSQNAASIPVDRIRTLLSPAHGEFTTHVVLLGPKPEHLLFMTEIVSTRGGENYYVMVGASEADIYSFLHNLAGTLMVGLPCLGLLAWTLGYLLMGRALRPVDRIVHSAEIITLQNSRQRLPVPATSDEFERLTRALNRMIDRLHEAFEQNKRFTEDASHELRTPLTVIRGELEYFLREGASPNDLEERLSSVLIEMERLSRVVEGLLMVSRLESGEARLHMEVVDLGQLVKSTADQMALLTDDKQQTLSYSLEEKVLAEVDSARFKQVVVNLLDNAVKYTPTGGSIRLLVYPQKKSSHPSTEHAVVEVSDSGIGIADADLPHLYERFFRADRARNSRTGGTGLGLSIVHSIVQAHGGSIHVRSREGQGTSFWIELPLLAGSSVGVACP